MVFSLTPDVVCSCLVDFFVLSFSGSSSMLDGCAINELA